MAIAKWSRESPIQGPWSTTRWDTMDSPPGRPLTSKKHAIFWEIPHRFILC